MDIRPFNNNGYSNVNEMKNSWQGMENTSANKIPFCINDDFCLPTPNQINNGILTMAFVDMQPLDEIYCMRNSYNAGTLFPNLDKPFCGGMKR